MTHMKIAISGMHCDGCIRAVEIALGALPGVGLERVGIGEAEVQLDESRASRANVLEAIRRSGDFEITGFDVSK